MTAGQGIGEDRPMTYNVFTDFHHASLLNSLIMLFEKRLGGQVYRPIGTEWFERGFWKIYDHPATVEQFLGINGATPDGSPPVNNIAAYTGSEDFFYCNDIDSGMTNKAITYNGFMNMDIDIVIASIPAHIEPFARLCELHPNHPKLIYQIGNNWNVPPGVPVKNVMASAIIRDPIPGGTHFVPYHQEFDLQIFNPVDMVAHPIPGSDIKSFVNCFSIDGLFANDWQLFQHVEKRMPTWTFRAHGGQCRDGAIGPSNKLAGEMRQSKFIWHTKQGGDGYGHVIYNSAAVGRPLITKIGYYVDKMGKELMIDGETCIGIDGLDAEQVANKIIHYSSDHVRYTQMCKNVQANFKKCVDFDSEFTSLQQFLQNLL